MSVAVVNSCACGKITYVSRREALTVAKRADRRMGRGGQTVYRCPTGEGWHLTSKSNGSKNRWAEREVSRTGDRDELARKREARRVRQQHKRQTARVTAPASGKSASSKPAVARPGKQTGCVNPECGRPWLSDIDPRGRCCPKCGGEVVIGRGESRDFQRELAREAA